MVIPFVDFYNPADNCLRINHAMVQGGISTLYKIKPEIFLEFSDNPVGNKDVVSPEGDDVANANAHRVYFFYDNLVPGIIT